MQHLSLKALVVSLVVGSILPTSVVSAMIPPTSISPIEVNYQASSGDIIQGTIEVFNSGKSDLQFQVRVESCTKNSLASRPVCTSTDASSSWIKLGVGSSIAIKSKSRVTIPYTVSIPDHPTARAKYFGVLLSQSGTLSDTMGSLITIKIPGAQPMSAVVGGLTAYDTSIVDDDYEASNARGFWEHLSDPLLYSTVIETLNPFWTDTQKSTLSNTIQINVPIVNKGGSAIIPGGSISLYENGGHKLIDIFKKNIPGVGESVSDNIEINPEKVLVPSSGSLSLRVPWYGFVESSFDSTHNKNHMAYLSPGLFYGQGDDESSMILPWNKPYYELNYKPIHAVADVILRDPTTGEIITDKQSVPLVVPYETLHQRLNTGLVFWLSFGVLLLVLSWHQRKRTIRSLLASTSQSGDAIAGTRTRATKSPSSERSKKSTPRTSSTSPVSPRAKKTRSTTTTGGETRKKKDIE